MNKKQLLNNLEKCKQLLFAIIFLMAASVLNGQTFVPKPMPKNNVVQNPYMSASPGSIHHDTYSSDVRDEVLPYMFSEVRYVQETEKPQSPAAIFSDSDGNAVSTYAPGVAIRDFSGSIINTIGQFELEGDTLLMAYGFVDREDRIVAPTKHGHVIMLKTKDDQGNILENFEMVLDVDLLDLVAESKLYEENETLPSLLGITFDYSGNLWFTTGGFRIDPGKSKTRGFIGYLSADYINFIVNTGSLEEPVLGTDLFFHLMENGEGAENGISSNETGAVILTNKACYMLQAKPEKGIHIKWRTPYESVGAKNAGNDTYELDKDGNFTNNVLTGGGLAWGSGTTPTLTSSLVLFTDNREVVHLKALSAETGKVLVEVPVMKPLTDRGLKVSVENSIIVYSPTPDQTSVIVCNWFGAGSPNLADPNFDPASYSYDALYDPDWVAEGDIKLYPGVERIDIVKQSGQYQAESKWLRQDLRGTAIMTLSTATGYLYTYAQDLATNDWYYCTLDFETGATVSKTITGNTPAYNNMAVGVFSGTNGNALYCPNNNGQTMCLWDKFAQLAPEASGDTEIDFSRSSRARMSNEMLSSLIGDNFYQASYLYTILLNNVSTDVPVLVFLNGLSGKKKDHEFAFQNLDNIHFDLDRNNWTLWNGDQKVTDEEVLNPETTYTLKYMISFTGESSISRTFILLKTGTGEKDSPYQIRTVAELVQLATDVNAGNSYKGKYFKLMNDIDLGPWCKANSATGGWVPIGNGGENIISFKGIFDGNGKSISNLSIIRESGTTFTPLGLFGCLKNAEVRNLAVENIDIYVGNELSGRSFPAGAIVGEASSYSVLSNCYSNGKIYKGNTPIGGGIAGYAATTTIENCYSDCNLNSYNNIVREIGGISGGIHTVNMNNCYATGTINACGGGISGNMSFYAHIKGCVALNDTIRSYQLGTGGSGKIIANRDLKDPVNNSVEDCLSYDKIAMIYHRCYEDVCENGEGKTGAELRRQATYEAIGWDFEKDWQIWEDKSYPYFHYQSAPAANVTATTDFITFDLRNNAEKVIIKTENGDLFYPSLEAGNAVAVPFTGTLGETLSITVYERDKAPSYTVNVKVLTPVYLTGFAVADKIYDGTTTAAIENQGNLSGVTEGDDVSLNTENLVAFSSKDVGENKPIDFYYSEALQGADADKYVLISPEVTASISPKDIYIMVDPQYKYYGDPDPEFTYTISPELFPGDYLEGALEREPGIGADSYEISGGLYNKNYQINYQSNHLTTYQALLIVTPNNDTYYFGFDPINYGDWYYLTRGFLFDDDESVLSGNITVMLADDITISTPPGSYPGKILASEVTADNYRIMYNTGTLTIWDPVAITVEEIQGTAATVIWTTNGEPEWKLEYKKQTETDWTPAAYSGVPSVSLSDLSANTAYTVRVKPVINNSFWFEKDFTTHALDDATLASLTVSEGELQPAFSAEVTAYTLSTALCGGTEITITGTPEDSYATVAGNLSSHLLSKSDSVVIITVTAEDGTTEKEYKINLTINPTYETPVSATITEGETYGFYGENLSTTGEYKHALQTIHGCDSVIVLTLTVTPKVSIQQVSETEFNVYPNPTTGKLRITNYELGNGSWMQSIKKVEVYDINGKKLLTINTKHSTQEIDLSGFANGVYILRINGEQTVKVVKK